MRAAERLFAERGYEAVSLRRIAVEAKAQLALIHYHFGTKQDLYAAVWAGRYAPAEKARSIGLAALDFDRPTRDVVNDLVDLVLFPLTTLDAPGGRDFLRLVGFEATDPDEDAHGFIERYVDPTARLWRAALRRALPALTDADMAWGYQVTIGAMTAHSTGKDRVTRLSDGAIDGENWREAKTVFRDFLVGGWLELDRRRREPGA